MNESKVYRIFFASSYHLEVERSEFIKEISALNDIFRERKTYIETVLWEKLDAGVYPKGKQSYYNKQLRNCDILVFVYWGELGMFTQEEYQIALNLFKKNGKPRIYIFKKTVPLPPTFVPNLQNIENLRILEKQLYQLEKAQWPWEINNHEALTKKIVKDVRNLFDTDEFKGFTYGDKKQLYNTISGNFNYIIRPDELIKAKEILNKNNHKILCIHGVSGSGKSKFVDNLLYDITEKENVVWIDCAESNPTPKEIAVKLKKIIHIDEISTERKHKLLSILPPEKQNTTIEIENRLVDDLADQLQSVTADDIEDWFPSFSKGFHRKKFIVLDDFDNLISEDGQRGHWLANNFLEKCLEYKYAPCLIIVFKYKESELDEDIKTLKYLNAVDNENLIKLRDLINFNKNSNRLRYLGGKLALKYVNQYDDIEEKFHLKKLIKLKDNWIPIQLQLLVQEFLFIKYIDKGKLEIEEIASFLKELKSSSIIEKDKAVVNFISKYLFQRIARKFGNEAIELVLVSSILQKYNTGHRAIDKLAIQEILTIKGDLSILLDNLATFTILKKFNNYSDSDEYTFQHDTKLEYAFEGIIEDRICKIKKEVKYEYHLKAAEYYSRMFIDEKSDESIRCKYGEFAVWNYSQIPDNWNERMIKALPLLNKIDRELRTSFNYIGLDELRRGLVNNSSIDNLEIKHESDFIDQQASNIADIAEIYYQGLDKWPKALIQSLKVYNHYKGNHSSLNAVVQATHLAAILNFEIILEPDHFLATFNQNGDYNDLLLKNKNKIYCIRLAESLLKQNLSIDVNKIYSGEYYDDDEITKLKDRAIIANLSNSLGVFLNRSEKYADAIKSYEFSIRILRTISKEIEQFINIQIEYCIQKYIRGLDEKEKNHWNKQKFYWHSLKNRWDEYIDKDLMCTHSNLSRSLLLSKGVDEAITYFEKNLQTWFGSSPQKSNPNHSYTSSQEYNYALMNICYYHLCKGNIVEANQLWNKSQDIPGEDWLKATKYQMKLVLMSYDIMKESKIRIYDGFNENIEAFGIIEDGRAILFSDFNRICLAIAEKLRDLKDNTNREDALTCDKLLDSLKLNLDSLKLNRITADTKEYFLAAKVITYTYNELLKQLKEVYKLAINIEPLEPHKSWKKEWENEVLLHLEGIMTKPSGENSFTPWRPPMLMAGILLMRSKPFAPSDDEIAEILRETNPEYNADKA